MVYAPINLYPPNIENAPAKKFGLPLLSKHLAYTST
jgi:hypothetical protein